MSDCEQCKSFFLELERLRRFVPNGTYTLNVAHEQEIQRLRDQADEWRLKAADYSNRMDEWKLKEGEVRDLLRAVALACRGLGPRTDAVMSVVGNALAELDEERAEAERWRNAHHEASIRLQAHDCGEEAAKLYERAGRAEEAVAKLGEQLNASEADCERFGKLLDDCRDLLMGQHDPDDVNAMIHRIDDAIGPCESLVP